jgi:hypothetical protein
MNLEIEEIKSESTEECDDQRTRRNSTPPNIDSLFALLPADLIYRIFKEYLHLRDKKSFAQTDTMLHKFFNQNGLLAPTIAAAKTQFITFFNQALRSKPEDLRALLDSRPEVVMLNEVKPTMLLIYVVKGEIKLAEEMLFRTPLLLERKCRVMDFSERIFGGEGISALQYSLAAKDGPMTKMLLSYFLKLKGGKQALVLQYEELAKKLSNEKAENHSALKSLNRSIDGLRQKVEAYVNTYLKHNNLKTFDRESNARTHNWCQIVGAMYRKLPAWVIEMLCEEGLSTSWVKKKPSIWVERNSKHLTWLFDHEYNGGKCGKNWAPSRGDSSRAGWAASNVHRDAIHDLEVLKLCQVVSPGELPTLDSLLDQDVRSQFNSFS